jgi:hypothetical protein
MVGAVLGFGLVRSRDFVDEHGGQPLAESAAA